MNMEALTHAMIDYYKGYPHQIQHFLKVHSFARLIGLGEGLDAATLFLLEAAALVHDIGIKPAMEKYGSGSGTYQELEGPPVAQEMLDQLSFSQEITDRICYLVGHHHTYTNIDGMDYQILVEADFLVNFHEEQMRQDAISSTYGKLFRTETGKALCRAIYRIQD